MHLGDSEVVCLMQEKIQEPSEWEGVHVGGEKGMGCEHIKALPRRHGAFGDVHGQLEHQDGFRSVWVAKVFLAKVSQAISSIPRVAHQGARL